VLPGHRHAPPARMVSAWLELATALPRCRGVVGWWWGAATACTALPRQPAMATGCGVWRVQERRLLPWHLAWYHGRELGYLGHRLKMQNWHTAMVPGAVRELLRTCHR
jgi:hypothetical protein